MRKFVLQDETLFYLNTTIYQNSLVSGQKPNYFEWVKSGDHPVFYTYSEVGNIDFNTTQDKYLILLESTEFLRRSSILDWVAQNHKHFRMIFTHNDQLLNYCENAKWIPGGGIWIGTEFGGGKVKLHDKTKLCSFMSSDKIMCELHQFRNSLHGLISKHNLPIDLFTGTAGNFTKPSEYLQDYMFSIIVENYVDEMYFTEKILNCFATGTIPVYLGARQINKIFDRNGILFFESPEEFVSSLDMINFDSYYMRMNAIAKNFDLCQQFACIEDFMWNSNLKKLYEENLDNYSDCKEPELKVFNKASGELLCN